MKKIKLLAVFGIVCFCLGTFFSCNANIKTSDGAVRKVEYEMEKLSSVAELDALATRGDDNIVDWQLSREFAELWLENGIAEGEYPANSELWQIPIAIYSSEGNIKFYEFRIISDNETVGAIVGAATKDYGCPIVYEGLKDGYADEITELYNSGKLSADQLPRIVDDGYPKVVAGIISETRGAADGFSGYLDLITGNEVSKDDIDSMLTYSETFSQYPDYVDLGLDDEKTQANIEAYNANAKVFWEMAVANKGHIADFAVRGTAKNDPGTLTSQMREYWKKYEGQIGYGTKEQPNIADYGACGPVAEGFVLDYLYANGLIGNTWNNYSQSGKKTILYDKLKVFAVFGDKDIGEATWPHNLGKAISCFGNYKVSLSGCICPEKAINNGLPGISLRVFGSGFAHYRPVIAYKKPGWWVFKWWEIKVLDLLDCTDKKNGSWETYIPVHHFLTYNVLKK